MLPMTPRAAQLLALALVQPVAQLPQRQLRQQKLVTPLAVGLLQHLVAAQSPSHMHQQILLTSPSMHSGAQLPPTPLLITIKAEPVIAGELAPTQADLVSFCQQLRQQKLVT